MPFNIDTFFTNIQDQGYLPTNKFEVYVMPPPIMSGGSLNNFGTGTNVRDITNGLRFRIEQIRTPGINLLTMDNNRYGVGPTTKYPYSSAFNELSFSIISDGFGDNMQFWHNWARSIFQFTSTDDAAVGMANQIANYTTEYRDNYATMMSILIYDNFGNLIQTINLYEAYPTSIKEIQLSWADQANPMRINVSMSYKEFTLVGSGFQSQDLVANQLNAVGDRTLGQILSTFLR